MGNKKITLSFMCLVFLVYGNTAYGYIDPGVGQFLWQLVFGFFAGALFLAERATGYIAAKIKRRRR